tara:strand:+ start:52 stop:390 length:339 start_codon:yes stop_codon:yes gene_type:complete
MSAFDNTNNANTNAIVPADALQRIPHDNTLRHVTKLAISEDKPVRMDYWILSLTKEAVIGVRNNDEKLLVKNAEEYTSNIKSIHKVENDYIVSTENSIYLVSETIPKKRIAD